MLLRCEGPRVTECVVVAIAVNGCHRGRSSWSNIMVVVCLWFSYVRNGGIDALRSLGCGAKQSWSFMALGGGSLNDIGAVVGGVLADVGLAVV